MSAFVIMVIIAGISVLIVSAFASDIGMDFNFDFMDGNMSIMLSSAIAGCAVGGITGSMFSWFGVNDMIIWIMFAVFTVITFAIVFILASRLKKNDDVNDDITGIRC